MTDDATANEQPASKALKSLGEDALGFEQVDLRTLMDLLLRPKTVLEAWMTEGANANGRYSRPLKLYLALNALFMLIMFLQGGMGGVLLSLPPEALTSFIGASGKSQDAFLADADGWMSLTLVPLSSLILALTVAPVLRLWDPDRLGWTRGFRATFGYLNAWAIVTLPFAWLAYGSGPVAAAAMTGTLGLAIVTFMRMGRGRWYRRTLGGLGKGAALLCVFYVASTIAMAIVIAIGVAAGVWF